VLSQPDSPGPAADLDASIRRALRSTGEITRGIGRILDALGPVIELLAGTEEITEVELHAALDGLFDALSRHPLIGELREITRRLREDRVLPNEQSTEDLIQFLVEQVHKRSAIVVPKKISDEFRSFFDELMSEPELRGLGDISLEVLRILVAAYEPLIVQLLNQLKELRRSNDDKLRDITASAEVVRNDLLIFRRQIGALRYVRLFFETEPKDFKTQAKMVASMVREFGPLFIKMAQVAAANSDFMPKEMAKALAVFREDVAPMTAAEVEQAFLESFGERPRDRYFGFNAARPLKSGSIASVYAARKPVHGKTRGGRKGPRLPVLVKVRRANLAREFLIGKTVIKLAIVSSHYWAPHSKLAPFLNSWLAQIDEFVDGFDQELDFEAEARNQARFAGRARSGDGWLVPQVYAASHRIIEMELIAGATNLHTAFGPKSRSRNEATQRHIGKIFLHAVLSQVLIHREFHGDLHPGNVLVHENARLYFIDWGNTIALEGIWQPALAYFRAVLAGDADAVTAAVLRMSTDPASAARGRAKIKSVVVKAFASASVTPLDYAFALTLLGEGRDGLVGRMEQAAGLTTALTRSGIQIRSEYLHLSRSIVAMIGSYASIYRGLPRNMMIRDAMEVGWRFPLAFGRFLAQAARARLHRQLR